MSYEFVPFDPDNPEGGGSYVQVSDPGVDPYYQEFIGFDPAASAETQLTAIDQVAEIENPAQPGQTGYGWKYYNNGTAVSPDGKYYFDGKLTYDPKDTGSSWGKLFAKMGDAASTPQGIAAILGTAYGMSGANKPTTGGYKGSIPNLTAIREKVKTPEYTPYSGKAVMGGKFFTDTQYTPTANTEAIEAAKTAATTTAEKYAATNPKAPDAAQSPLSIAQQKSTAVKAEAKPMSSLLDTYKIVGQPAITPEGIQFIEPVKKETPAQLDDTVVDLNTWRVNPAPVTPEGIKFGEPAKEKPNVTTPIDPERSLTQPVISPNQPGEVEELMRSYTGAQAAIPAAQGGIMQLAKGRYLRGETDGMSDKIPSSIDGVQPAALSHGEFVIPADVVSHLGNGNSDAGADQLYKMMDRVRKDRTGTTKQGKQIKPEKYFPGGVAYSKGGIASFQAGGDTALSRAAGSNPLGATQETTLAPWVGDYATNMLGRAQALAGEGYQAYEGPLSAGTSPLQQQAFTAAGKIDPNATFDVAAAQQYMNPFVQMALAPQLEEMRRQANISRQETAGRLAKAGAFGGGRQAIMESELLRNLGQQQALTTGKAYETAFDKAMGQYNVGRQQTLADLGTLAGLGAQERTIEQQGIDQLRGEFEKQRQFPYEQLKFQQSMLGGLPIGSTSITPNTSPLSNLMLTTEQVGKLSDWLKTNVFNTPPG